jgi:hypothetical protein
VAVNVHRHIGQEVLGSAVSRELLAADSHCQAAVCFELVVWAGVDLAVDQRIASFFAFRLSLTSFHHFGLYLGRSWAGRGSIPFEEVP